MEDPKERKERIRSKLRVAMVLMVLALVLAFLIYFSLVALGRVPLPRLPERPAAEDQLPAATETPAESPTPSSRATPTPTPLPTETGEASEEPSAEMTGEMAPTAAAAPTPTAAAVPTPTATAAPTPAATAEPTPTATAEPTPTATAAPTPTATAAPTPAATAAPTPTATAAPTPTAAAAPTPTAAAVPTPTAAAAPKPTATAAPTPAATAVPIPAVTPLAKGSKDLILPADLQSVGRWDWRLQIANYDLRLDEDFVPAELVEIESGQYVDARIEMPLRELFRAAREAGYSLYFCSGFRDYDTQSTIYWRHINDYMYLGYSFEEADALTRLSVNVPGASEHQLGLTADVLAYPGQDMMAYIGGSGLMGWLEKNCARYGFIIRYPEGKTDITGVDYEPWHLRYVGTAAAEYITRNGLCLEEFLQLRIERRVEFRQQSETAAESPESPAHERGKNQ